MSKIRVINFHLLERLKANLYEFFSVKISDFEPASEFQPKYVYVHRCQSDSERGDVLEAFAEQRRGIGVEFNVVSRANDRRLAPGFELGSTPVPHGRRGIASGKFEETT